MWKHLFTSTQHLQTRRHARAFIQWRDDNATPICGVTHSSVGIRVTTPGMS